MTSAGDALSQVRDRESFFDFLNVLASEWREAEAALSDHPYDPLPHGWECQTLTEFLDALAMTARYSTSVDEPEWVDVARILYRARSGALDLQRRRAAERRAREPDGQIVLRLDDWTARLLYDLFEMIGEYQSAGAELPQKYPREEGERLAALYNELGGQLGLPSMAMSMYRALDEKRRHERDE